MPLTLAATNCNNPESTHHEPFNSDFKRSTLSPFSLPPSVPSSAVFLLSRQFGEKSTSVGRERGKGFDKLILIPASAACVNPQCFSHSFCRLGAIFPMLFWQVGQVLRQKGKLEIGPGQRFELSRPMFCV